MNKTGIKTSPKLTEEMLSGGNAVPVEAADHEGSLSEIIALRKAYIGEADPIGTIPPPTTLKGMMSAGATALKGESPSLLIDKMGERLAFERSGVRLYDSFLVKCEAIGKNIDIARVREIRAEEARHMVLLLTTLENIGADPTAQTPSADAAAVATMGFIQVLNDPRTTLEQCIEVMLAAELIDTTAWETLERFAMEAGMKEIAQQFADAGRREAEHLVFMKSWHQAIVLGEKPPTVQ